MSAFAVRMAHKCAMRLLDRSQAIWSFFESFGKPVARQAMAAARELHELRAKLKDCVEEADERLRPQLEEFACVHEVPVEVNGFTASSAHKATLMVAQWAGAPERGTDRVKAFLGDFCDEGTGKIDWDRVHKQDHPMRWCLMENQWHEDWAAHRAMLEIELAKAMRLPPVKRAEVKLNAREQAIVTALGHETLQYRQIAARADLKANSELRKKLAEMARRGLLEGGEEGYSLGRLLS